MSDGETDQSQGTAGDAEPATPQQTAWYGQSEGQEPRNRDQGRQQREYSSNARRFLFIDSSIARNTSSEAIRVHVMRESHRSRRERGNDQSRRHTQRTGAQDEMVILHRTRPNITTPQTTSDVLTGTAIDLLRNSTVAINWPVAIRIATSQASQESLQELYSFTEELRNSRSVQQPDVLHLCRGDLLTLCAYLALFALRLATGSQGPESRASAQFEARALELLRLRITQRRSIQSDSTLVAVLLMSQLEYKGNFVSARFHIRALRNIVHDRGGLETLRSEAPELHNVLLRSGLMEVTE